MTDFLSGLLAPKVLDSMTSPQSASALLNLGVLEAQLGEEIGTSPWIEITQDLIGQFGRVTRDEFWLHLDPDRARRESPFGSTIAHGFLLLSMLSWMYYEAFGLGSEYSGLNYGLNRVRFITPVKAGARVRARFKLLELRRVPSGADFTWSVVLDCEGSDRPALVAEWITRFDLPRQ